MPAAKNEFRANFESHRLSALLAQIGPVLDQTFEKDEASL